MRIDMVLAKKTDSLRKETSRVITMTTTKPEGRLGLIRHIVFALPMIVFLVSLVSACASPISEKQLVQPEKIIVYSNGVESEYTEEDREYSAAFDLLMGTYLDGALETAVDSQEELKKCDRIEFIYESSQHTGEGNANAGSVSREYDRLLFLFSGPNAGEVVLGRDGAYMSGTYKMSTTT